jgi:hypothetical protein
VPEVQFDDHLLGANLLCESSEPNFVSVCGGTKGELSSELLRKRLFQSDSSLVVEFSVLLNDAVRFGNFLLGERLHTDQKAAALAVTTRPLFDLFVELSPSTQVEVADAKV